VTAFLGTLEIRLSEGSRKEDVALSAQFIANFFDDDRHAPVDSRSPDIVVEPEFGVIYAKPTFTGKAEHGGLVDEDRHVTLLIANPALGPQEVHAAVGTPQIAPTILRLLGLDPNSLQAVKIEKTEVLPGLW
jgi:hypothetical protein